jgi:hypothetical protein
LLPSIIKGSKQIFNNPKRGNEIKNKVKVTHPASFEKIGSDFELH